MTPAERALWAALRNRRLDGLKFRRQHPLGPFIVDLCCPDRLLIVEIDGNIHDQQFDYDEERSRLLEEFGYEVIRFRNEDIIHHLGNVLREISSVAANRVAASQQRPRE
jgi:very-short-patch-repair endonuclease